MKTRFICIALAVAGVFCACSRDEESLFDKSAAQRAQEALDHANEVLLAAPNGWECLYFANTESRGYNLILRFKKDGSVKASTKNELTTKNKLETDSNSVWVVTYDYGPILSFNTYNSVLHAWADPMPDGDGYLGDYEFLILKADPERVVLKGKKHGGYTILRPMRNMDDEAYFDQCNAQLAKFFGGGNILTLKQDTNLYYLHEGSTGLFNITKVGEKAASVDPILYPICPTLEGFAMCYGFNGMKNERIYTYDSTRFVGEAGSTIEAGNLCDLFEVYIDVNKGWAADFNASSGEFAEAVTAFQDSLIALTKDSKAKINSLAITYHDSINFYQGAYLLRIKYEYKAGKNKTNLTADYLIDTYLTEKGDSVVVEYGRPHNSTAKTWYEQLQAMPVLVNSVMGTFALEAVDPINPVKGLKMINDKSEIVVSGSTNLK